MEHYIRFAVHQRVSGEPRRVGLFTAAYWVLQDDGLHRHDRARVADLLAWFEAELALPPRGAIPNKALFWYVDARPFSARMWDLAYAVDAYGFTTELVAADFVGRIVYADRHQVAAIPCKQRPVRVTGRRSS